MNKHRFAILAVIAALGLGPPALKADHGDKGQKHQRGNKHVDDDNDQGWERLDGYEYRTYNQSQGRPPGWSKGKKTGWGNCGLPPGQAKKYGSCQTYDYQGRSYYYYQNDAGQIIVRRPTIEIHGSVDIVP